MRLPAPTRPAAEQVANGKDPAGREWRHLRLQGGGARAPGREGRSRRARDPDRGLAALRRARDVRGNHRRARCSSKSSSATPRAAPIPGEAAPDHDPISHLEMAARCDAYCIAPATANTIAKLATGQADNLLTAAYLACAAPVLVAPAMNNRMYEHAATQANLETLRARGVHVVEPGHRPARLARRVGHRPAGRARRDPRGDRDGRRRRAAPARRHAGAGHRRRHARAARLGALRRQPLQRPDGLRAGGRGGPPRRRASPWSPPTPRSTARRESPTCRSARPPSCAMRRCAASSRPTCC